MRTFSCTCGNTLHFENTQCLACGRKLAFDPMQMQLVPFEADDAARYQLCRNYTEYNVCNWLVEAQENQSYCKACRLNQTIPDLTISENHVLWSRIEIAKRRLLYTLYMLKLPVITRADDPVKGLCFQFLAEEGAGEFCDAMSERKQVLTGHDHGNITINIAEADPVQRTVMREKMGEEYRTLLGHFRHEIGHYYWEHLLGTAQLRDSCRTLFGDEREDYASALQQYYQQGAKKNWSAQYISAYASAHPWEDFAETFAHYLHMTDTLETAYNYHFVIDGRSLKAQDMSNQSVAAFDAMLRDWAKLAMVMNDLNRSMGLRDAYPFAITEKIANKLRFVHQLICSNLNLVTPIQNVAND